MSVVVRASAVRAVRPAGGVAARVVSVHHRVAGAFVHMDVNGQIVVGVPAPGLSVAIGDRRCDRGSCRGPRGR